jgi:hypothetical protein
MKILLLNMQNDKNNTIMENTMELYQSPTSTFDGQDYECVCCGRKLKPSHNEICSFKYSMGSGSSKY